MDSIEGQARASHSWTLLSSPHQGMQASSTSSLHMPANGHLYKWDLRPNVAVCIASRAILGRQGGLMHMML